MTARKTLTPAEAAFAMAEGRRILKRARKAGGPRSLWTIEDHARFEAGPHYDRAGVLPPLVVWPPRLDMLRERERPAEVAAEAVVELSLVTHVPPPWRRIELAELPTGARTFARWLSAHSFDVAARAAGPVAFEVGAARDGVFTVRATWAKVGADGSLLKTLSSKGARVNLGAGWVLYNLTEAKAAIESAP